MSVRAITWHEGRWVEGNPPIFGPFTHSLWMASAVFDGARAFRRLAPDLDRHCARVVESARAFGMKPEITGDEMRDGDRRDPRVRESDRSDRDMGRPGVHHERDDRRPSRNDADDEDVRAGYR